MMDQWVVSNHGDYGWLCLRCEDSALSMWQGVKRLW